MNSSNANQFLPLVEALADGKTLQYFIDGKWGDMNSNGTIGFDGLPERYRVKPEPRECWAVYVKGTGELWGTHRDKPTLHLRPDLEIVHYREVTQ